MISAGRVLIMPKGQFDPTVQYEMLDLVSYNGSSYIAKSSTIGNLPTDTTYWQLSAFGAASTSTSANFATLETSALASNPYEVGEYLVDFDGKLCKVTAHIDIGDQIIIGSNVKQTTVEEMVSDANANIENLKANTRSLIPLIEIETMTDLNTVTDVGEYYKKLSGFFVTNAPLGIDSIPTAKFRLTVMNGADSNTKRQTLTTEDNKVYSRSLKSSVWSSWIQSETKLTYDGPTADWDALSHMRRLFIGM